MALLADIEQLFEASYQGGELDRAFALWREGSQAVAALPDLDSLIAYCRHGTGTDLDLRDQVVSHLCLEAVAGDERAALLVIWLHLPGLWEAIDELRPGPLLDPEDLDAELLTGFWQAARGAGRVGGISARLIIRAYWTAWEALQGSKRDIVCRTDEDLNPESISVGTASDAIREAREAAVISGSEARLIEAVRLVGISDEEIAHECGSTKSAVRKRRLRAEARVVAWIRGDAIPARRNLDGRGLKRQKSGSCVYAGSSNGAKAATQVRRKEESPELRIGDPVQQPTR